jgi:hypothetical protein
MNPTISAWKTLVDSVGFETGSSLNGQIAFLARSDTGELQQWFRYHSDVYNLRMKKEQ